MRLEIANDCPKAITAMLIHNFQLEETDVYRCDGPVNIIRAGLIYDWIDRPELKYPRFNPQLPAALESTRNKFDLISQRDVLLHHPYQSFGAVISVFGSR